MRLLGSRFGLFCIMLLANSFYTNNRLYNIGLYGHLGGANGLREQSASFICEIIGKAPCKTYPKQDRKNQTTSETSPLYGAYCS